MLFEVLFETTVVTLEFENIAVYHIPVDKKGSPETISFGTSFFIYYSYLSYLSCFS